MPEDDPKAGSSSASRYDIEYTNPGAESTAQLKPIKPTATALPVQTPVQLHALSQKKSIPTPPLPPVHAAPMPIPVAKPAPIVKPVVPVPVVKPVAKPVPVPAPIAPAPVKFPVMPAQPAPIAKPLPAPKTIPVPVPTPTIQAAPALSGAPRQTMPATTGGPRQTGKDATQDIVAQNVESMHGAATNPEALPPGGLDVNLLPSHALTSANQSSLLTRLLQVVFYNVLALTIIYGIMIAYQSYFLFQTQTSQQSIVDLDNTIASYSTLQQHMTATNTTLTGIAELLAGHVYWSHWFTFLETYTSPEVFYTGFSGGKDGVMNLEAVTNDFSNVSKQVNLFQSLPEVKAVTVTTATRSSDSTSTDSTAASGLVNFTISLKVDPSLLTYSSPYGTH